MRIESQLDRRGGGPRGMNIGRALAARVGTLLAACTIELAAPRVYAAPSASCCFTGSIWTCDDDTAIDAVCDYDPFCCTTAWDLYCVYEYELYHDWTCPPLFEGNYGAAGDVELSEYDADVCGGDYPFECKWNLWFDLPASVVGGSSTIADLAFEVYCPSMGGGGGEDAPMKIFSNTNGVMRGVLETGCLGHVEGACEGADAVRFEVVPRTAKSCHAASNAPGCNSPVIERFVCHSDPFCCETAWDWLCVAQAPDWPSY